MDKAIFALALVLSCALWWYREPVPEVTLDVTPKTYPMTRDELPQPPPPPVAESQPRRSTTNSYPTPQNPITNNPKHLQIRVSPEVASLIQRGTLEWATRAHLSQWAQEVHRAEMKGIGVHSMPSPEGLTRPAFVIKGPMEIPRSLREPNTIIFYIAKGAPLPTGELGYAQILDFNTLQCHGTGCFTPDR